MPPLRTDRASKACTTCRRQKTRCYQSENGLGACLRCQTLKQSCSLDIQNGDTITEDGPNLGREAVQGSAINQRYPLPPRVLDTQWLTWGRLDRLECALVKLVDRIDLHLGPVPPLSNTISTNDSASRDEGHGAPSEEPDEAPVILIRDAATEIGIQSPRDTFASPVQQYDILSKGLLSYSEAYRLISM